MYNWSTNTTRLKKNPDQYNIFMLEQMINFGLDNKKLPLSLLKKHWNKLNIDPNKKTYLKKIVWTQSSQNNKS